MVRARSLTHLQSIAVLGLLRRLFKRNKFLIITPLSTVPNWLREFQRFAPDMDAVVFGGSEESRSVCLKYDLKHRHSFEVVITSFEVATNNISKLTPIEWDALIVDEGHRLKSREALGTRMISQLEAEWRVILTGTPIQNCPDELINLLQFLRVPEVVSARNKEALAAKFALENLRNPDVLAEMHALVRPRMLRRVKVSVRICERL